MINCSGNKGATFFPPLDAAYEFFFAHTLTHIYLLSIVIANRCNTSERRERVIRKVKLTKRHLTTFLENETFC